MNRNLSQFQWSTDALEGPEPLVLAAIRGTDIRRNLPKEIFVKKPWRFCLKFWFAMVLIALCCLIILGSGAFLLKVPAGIVLGLLYAHLIELQHEALHEHAFRSRRLNRLYGIACGVFMLSSYSAYKYEHLRHHASLGKPGNREFFNYRFSGLDSWSGFVRAAFHLGRYLDVLRDIARSLVGLPLPNVSHARDTKRIQVEYRLFAVLLLAVLVYTSATGDLFFVWAWWLPALLVAEPTHFFIEMPEHFGLDTQTNPDVLANTRTIKAGRFAQWFTNFNNLHTAHHFHQGVPMARSRELNQLVTSKFQEVEISYLAFYRKVLRGEIKYGDSSATCMTR
jgi:fatty acid desaturase